jgi:hypothetical protein
MAVEQTKDLMLFLKPFPAHMQETALWLREFVWKEYPHTNELIYDGYNALAFGWSLTDKVTHTFCSVAVYGSGLHFGFYYGTEIADPDKRLAGKGNQYRYFPIQEKKDFPKTYAKKLMKEAYANSLAKVNDAKQIIKGQTIVKLAMAKKKRPGMEQPQNKKK